MNSFKAGRIGELKLHPTVKPVEMIADAIRDVSARGDIVLDLFGGSGSTLIAAEKTGRRGYLCELDPIYCDRIIRRWEAYAKDEAELDRLRYRCSPSPDPARRPNEAADDDKRQKALAVRPDTAVYDVGYGKPPAATRFKSGQSGNPHGRPKGSTNKAKMPALNEERMKSILLEEAYRTIKVNEGTGPDQRAHGAGSHPLARRQRRQRQPAGAATVHRTSVHHRAGEQAPA